MNRPRERSPIQWERRKSHATRKAGSRHALCGKAITRYVLVSGETNCAHCLRRQEKRRG